MSKDFEMPGLNGKLKDKHEWLTETRGAKHVSVQLSDTELTYIRSCIAYYTFDAAMRRAEKLPLAGLPPITGTGLMAKYFREDVARVKASDNCGHCHTCAPITMENMRMILCETCGNKRCPKANDHRNECTGSNEPGQPGSAYPAVPWASDTLPCETEQQS